jgi:phosphomevalonate kinase
MTAIVASAPGKLFLAGEYVVLRGAPALVAAIDRRVSVRFDPGGDALRIESVVEDRTCTVVDPAATRDEGDVGAVLAAARATDIRAGGVVVDSTALLSGTRKLGLGRSAATVVAASAAFLAADREWTKPLVRSAALAANEDFQHGLGSGADVAASVHGGIVEVRRTAGDVVVAPCELPGGLELVVAWTGEGAATVPLLERFATAASSPALSELGTVTESAVDAVTGGDADAFCEAVRASAALLGRLGDELGMPIVTPALARLIEIAESRGAAAKPSGAGAGDCAIAFTRSVEDAEALRAAWAAAGFMPLPIAVAEEGVRVA